MARRVQPTPPAAYLPDDDWKKGLPPDADDQLHRVMVEAGIWDEGGKYIPDPNFWPDAVDLKAGRITLKT